MARRPSPTPGEGQALVRIEAAGVCRLDLTQFDRGPESCAAAPILGHEGAGVVEQLGQGCRGIEIGDRVVIDPVTPCGRCQGCLQAMPNLCTHPVLLGYRGVPGTWCTHLSVASRRLHRLGPSVPMRAAVLAEPMADVIHLLRHLDSPPNGPVIILGAGVIGLLALALLGTPRLWGHVWSASALVGPPVTIVEPDADRRRLALAFGAASAVTPDELQSMRSSRRLVIEASGASDAMDSLLGLLMPGGTGLVLGGALNWQPKVGELIRSEATLRGSFGYLRKDMESAVKVLGQDPEIALALVSTVTMGEAPQRIRSLRTGDRPTPRLVIEPRHDAEP